MATTLYLRTTTSGTVLGDKWPQNSSTTLATDVPSGGVSNVNERRGALTTAGSSATTLALTSVAGAVTDPGLAIAHFESLPLASDVTISGSIAFDIWAYESSMLANATVRVVIWRLQPDGTTSVIVNSSYATEIGTSNGQNSWTATPTSTNCLAGDVLITGIYFDDYSGGNMGTGYTLTLSYDAAEGATGDSQVRLTETLSFAGTPSGTTAYMLNSASDVSGSGSLKLWTDSAGSQASKVVNLVASPNFAQWTDSAGGNALTWFTPQLAAGTITGGFACTFFARNPSGYYPAPLVRVYKTDSDGSNPVLVGQGRSTAQLQTSFTSTTVSGAMAATLTAGQRLAVRVYTASLSSYYKQASGSTATISVNDTTRTAIQFPATLTEYSPNATVTWSTPIAAVTATPARPVSGQTVWGTAIAGVTAIASKPISATVVWGTPIAAVTAVTAAAPANNRVAWSTAVAATTAVPAQTPVVTLNATVTWSVPIAAVTAVLAQTPETSSPGDGAVYRATQAYRSSLTYRGLTSVVTWSAPIAAVVAVPSSPVSGQVVWSTPVAAATAITAAAPANALVPWSTPIAAVAALPAATASGSSIELISETFYDSSTGVTNWDFNVTIDEATDFIVVYHIFPAAVTEAGAATWNGTSMTYQGESHSAGAGLGRAVGVFTMVAPTTGTHTMRLSVSASYNQGAIIQQWSGVDQTTPVVAASLVSSAGNTGTSVTPSTGSHWPFTGAIGHRGTVASSPLTYGGTQVSSGSHVLAGGTNQQFLASYQLSGSTMTFGWTVADYWAYIGLALTPAAPASPDATVPWSTPIAATSWVTTQYPSIPVGAEVELVYDVTAASPYPLITSWFGPVETTLSTTGTIYYPLSKVVPDTVLFLVMASKDSSFTSGTPSGWTALGDGSTTGVNDFHVFTKVATGDEFGSSISVTTSAGTAGEGVIFAMSLPAGASLDLSSAQVFYDTDTSSTAFQASSSSMTTAANDFLLVIGVAAPVSGSFSAGFSGYSLTQSGATLSSFFYGPISRNADNTLDLLVLGKVVTAGASAVVTPGATAVGQNARGVFLVVAARPTFSTVQWSTPIAATAAVTAVAPQGSYQHAVVAGSAAVPTAAPAGTHQLSTVAAVTATPAVSSRGTYQHTAVAAVTAAPAASPRGTYQHAAVAATTAVTAAAPANTTVAWSTPIAAVTAVTAAAPANSLVAWSTAVAAVTAVTAAAPANNRVAWGTPVAAVTAVPAIPVRGSVQWSPVVASTAMTTPVLGAVHVVTAVAAVTAVTAAAPANNRVAWSTPVAATTAVTAAAPANSLVAWSTPIAATAAITAATPANDLVVWGSPVAAVTAMTAPTVTTSTNATVTWEPIAIAVAVEIPTVTTVYSATVTWSTPVAAVAAVTAAAPANNRVAWATPVAAVTAVTAANPANTVVPVTAVVTTVAVTAAAPANNRVSITPVATVAAVPDGVRSGSVSAATVVATTAVTAAAPANNRVAWSTPIAAVAAVTAAAPANNRVVVTPVAAMTAVTAAAPANNRITITPVAAVVAVTAVSPTGTLAVTPVAAAVAVTAAAPANNWITITPVAASTAMTAPTGQSARVVVTPVAAVVAVTAAAPAHNRVTVTPVAATTALYGPVVQGSVLVSPVAASTAMTAPTGMPVRVTVTPVAAVVAMSAPPVQTSDSATVVWSPIPVTVAVPTQTPVTVYSATVTWSAPVAAVTAVPAQTPVVTSNATITWSTPVAAVVAVPPRVITGSVLASTVATTTAFPSGTLPAAVPVSPVAAAAALPAGVLPGSVTVSPVAAVAAIPAQTPSVTDNASVTWSTPVAAVAAVPTQTPAVSWGATVTWSSPVAAVAALATQTPVVSSDATVTWSAVAATVALPSVTVSTSTSTSVDWTPPALTTAVHGPSPQGSWSGITVLATSSVLLPSVQTSTSASVSWAAIATFAALDVPGIGSTVGADVALRHPVRMAVNSETDLRATTRSLVAHSTELLWGTRSLVGDQVALEHATRTLLNLEAELAWTTLALVGDDLVLVWGVSWPTGASAFVKINGIWRTVIGVSIRDDGWTEAELLAKVNDVFIPVTLSP